MPVVKFDDIEVGKIYVTRGGLATIVQDDTSTGWGYERVRVVHKNGVKVVVETPWGTLCALASDYPLSATQEVEVRKEFKLLTTHISKEAILFDAALDQGICVECATPEEVVIPESVEEGLITFCSTPQTIAALARKLGKKYQQVRYAIDRIAMMNKYNVIVSDGDGGKTVQITEVK